MRRYCCIIGVCADGAVSTAATGRFAESVIAAIVTASTRATSARARLASAPK
jgi:hypothetical protein